MGLTDSDYLWRYVPLNTLLVYLSGEVFIPSVEKLVDSDPFEGKFVFDAKLFELVKSCARYGPCWGEIEDWIRSARCTVPERLCVESKDGPREEVLMWHFFQYLRATRYAWCWFHPVPDMESAAMWNTYGKNGVAVRTTVGQLSAALAKSAHMNFLFGKMTYVKVEAGKIAVDSPAQDPNLNDLLPQPHFLKREEYEHEHEVRYVTCGPESPVTKGIFIGVQPGEWIEEIRLWPGMTMSETAAVKNLVRRSMPDVKCEKSDLFNQQEQLCAPINTQIRSSDRRSDRQWREEYDGIPLALKQL